MNNILFNILENKFKESEEFRTLVYTDVFVHKLFYDYNLHHQNISDEQVVTYLVELFIELVKCKNEIRKELINKKANVIELNNYQISKEFVNECIRNLSFKEKIKMLFRGK